MEHKQKESEVSSDLNAELMEQFGPTVDVKSVKSIQTVIIKAEQLKEPRWFRFDGVREVETDSGDALAFWILADKSGGTFNLSAGYQLKQVSDEGQIETGDYCRLHLVGQGEAKGKKSGVKLWDVRVIKKSAVPLADRW